MKRQTVYLFVITLVLVAPLALGQEVGINRPGSDLRPGFVLSRDDPDLCREACENDPACKAYTYVRPGYQGPSGRCWLKSAAPKAIKSDCCVSGVTAAQLNTIVAMPLAMKPSAAQNQLGKELAAAEAQMGAIYEAMHALLKQAAESKKAEREAARVVHQQRIEASLAAADAKKAEIDAKREAAQNEFIKSAVSGAAVVVASCETKASGVSTLLDPTDGPATLADMQRARDVLAALRRDIATLEDNVSKMRELHNSSALSEASYDSLRKIHEKTERTYFTLKEARQKISEDD